jgi:hypothetical protein
LFALLYPPPFIRIASVLIEKNRDQPEDTKEGKEEEEEAIDGD